MKDRVRIILYSVVFMGGIATVAVAITVCMLYNAAFDQTEMQLTDTVNAHANLIEAIGRFDRLHSQDVDPRGASYATMSQVIDAHEQVSGFGKTGEFTLATLENDNIVFLLSHRHDNDSGSRGHHATVPMSGTMAEPMRRALQGDSGTIVGLDYRGETVLA
ncbi:MAG: hypothetical protein JKY95_09755, partial [Planctomycetaceae bacterium]|nr:hypothetical protein [Planctomycetaceae bacterium]